MKKLRQTISNIKLGTKLTISYLLICIIPLAALGSFAYSQANNFLIRQARVNIVGNVRQIADAINVRATQYKLITDSILYNFQYQQIFNSPSGNSEKEYTDYVDPFFNNILFLNSDILQITVFTSNKALVHGDYIKNINLLDDLAWFRKSIATDDLLWYSRNGKLLCLRAFKNTAKTANAAVLYISIDTDKLFESLYKSQQEDFGAVVINRDGTEIMNRNLKTGVRPILKNLPFTDGIATWEEGSVYYFIVKSEIATPGWDLYYYIPVNAISIDTRQIAMATVLIIVICMVVLSLLIWSLSRSFVKRLRYLNRSMELVENGNFEIPVISHSKDEIGELTSRFARMLGKIKTLIDEVYTSRVIQKEAELKALQAQINPHFLYNSLSIINWKAIQIDATEISQITNTISTYYRTVLNRGRNTLSIADEIQNARLYMQIQLIMHNNKFDFIVNVDEGLFEYDMINLILQPLLENALDHGIDKKRKDSGRGRLTLKGYFIDGGIEFLVEDNGPGMTESLVSEVLTQDSKGYGLKNVNERISLFFGAQYGLKIVSKEKVGTSVYIRIPKFKH